MGLPLFRNPKHRHLKALLVPEALLALLCVADVSLISPSACYALTGKKPGPFHAGASTACTHDAVSQGLSLAANMSKLTGVQKRLSDG